MNENDTTAPAARSPRGADPVPLGLGGLAVTMFLFCAKSSGLMGVNLADIWLSTGLFYGGLAQFMAGVWQVRRGDTFLLTVFGSFGAFWMGLAVLSFFPAASGLALPPIPHNPNVALSFFFLTWAALSAIFTIAAIRTNATFLTLLGLMTIAFTALWLGRLGNAQAGNGLTAAGGFIGMASTAVASYGVLATLVNATWGGSYLPLGNLSRSPGPTVGEESPSQPAQ